jgi:hypothetical protein
MQPTARRAIPSVKPILVCARMKRWCVFMDEGYNTVNDTRIRAKKVKSGDGFEAEFNVGNTIIKHGVSVVTRYRRRFPPTPLDTYE